MGQSSVPSSTSITFGCVHTPACTYTCTHTHACTHTHTTHTHMYTSHTHVYTTHTHTHVYTTHTHMYTTHTHTHTLCWGPWWGWFPAGDSPAGCSCRQSRGREDVGVYMSGQKFVSLWMMLLCAFLLSLKIKLFFQANTESSLIKMGECSVLFHKGVGESKGY